MIRLCAAAACAVALLAGACASAAGFPIKPIRMIIASPPGAGSDVIARLVGNHLAAAWGQQVVFDNRPGATGLLSAEMAAKAPADGYTLWMPTMTQLIGTTLYNRYNMAREFQPVSLLASTPFVLAVNAALPVQSVADLIAYAKARPGKVLYGSSGQGSVHHLCMELFRSLSGVNMVHVPYKGSTFTLVEMAGGHIQAGCTAPPAMASFVQSGKLRALGTTARTSTRLTPGLPAIAETVPGFEIVGWYGVLAPLGTPKQITEQLSTEIARAVRRPDFQEQLIALGADPVGSNPAEFAKFLQSEIARWSKVLREAGITATD